MQADPGATPPILFRASLADDLPGASTPTPTPTGTERENENENENENERDPGTLPTPSPPRLSVEAIDSALVDMLSDPPAEGTFPQTPIFYLIGAYGRASHLLGTTVSYLKDKEAAGVLFDALKAAQAMIINYMALMLDVADIFPQPPSCLARGQLRLLDALERGSSAEGVAKYGAPIPPLVPGLLDDLCEHMER